VLGEAGFATVSVTGPEPVVVLEVDLMGDNLPRPTRIIGSDLRLVRTVLFTPEKRGTFGVEARVVDAIGCTGSSATQVRNVVVR
jgi:hypothetical protein